MFYYLYPHIPLILIPLKNLSPLSKKDAKLCPSILPFNNLLCLILKFNDYNNSQKLAFLYFLRNSLSIIRVTQSKKETFSVERTNCRIRHFFARFHRRTLSYTKSIDSLKLSIPLFILYLNHRIST